MKSINNLSSAPILKQSFVPQAPNRAQEATLTDKVEISEKQEDSSFFTPGKLAMAGLAGALGIAAFAAPTSAHADTSVSIHVGNGGWGVTIHDGHHGHHGHRHGHHGHHHGHRNHNHSHRHGNYRHRHPHSRRGHHHGHRHDGGWHNRGPHTGHWSGWGMDGKWHTFDSCNYVDDHTGHYQFRYDMFGNLYRDYNVSCP